MNRAACLAASWIVGIAGACQACPVDELWQRIELPLDAFKVVVLPVAESQSTEGGEWHVYLRDDGVPHAIARSDYGETGQSRNQAWFVDRRSYVIRVTSIRYRDHFAVSSPVEIVKQTTTTYVYCDDQPYLSAYDDDTERSKREAPALREVFLAAAEIAEYLGRLPR